MTPEAMRAKEVSVNANGRLMKFVSSDTKPRPMKNPKAEIICILATARAVGMPGIEPAIEAKQGDMGASPRPKTA